MGTITRTFANNITTGGKFDATDLTGTLPASTISDASVTNIEDVPALVATTTVATDPPSPDNGQMWYNTTERRLKAFVLSNGSWEYLWDRTLTLCILLTTAFIVIWHMYKTFKKN